MQLILAILFVLLLLYIIRLMAYRSAWKKIPIFRQELPSIENKIWLSIIIPARNEADNIKICLDSLSKQSLNPSVFEIIVVDDRSEDSTVEIVEQFSMPNLSLIRMSDFPETVNSGAPKKSAIEKAIGRARGQWIVTTDADCIFNEKWLSTILSFYQTNPADLLVMPVLIDPVKSVLNRFESLDFLTLQAVTAAGAQSGKLNMCNGANLSYSKKIFEQVRGFEGINHVASGDDMLLMEKIKTAGGRIHYLLSPEVIVKTNPVKNLKAFIHQRRRWAGKSASYSDSNIKLTLLLVYSMNLFFLIAGLGWLMVAYKHIDCIPVGSVPTFFLSMLALKLLTEWIFLYPVASFYYKKNLFIELLLFQPLHIPYIVATGFLGLLGKYEWKGRRLK